MDPEIVEMVRFLDPEIVEKVDKSFMWSEVNWMFSSRENVILQQRGMLSPKPPWYLLLILSHKQNLPWIGGEGVYAEAHEFLHFLFVKLEAQA